jgi:hypothetical protein
VHGVYTRTVTPKRGPNAGRKVKLYDVRFTVDGWGFSRTIERKGWADDFANRLRVGFASGHLFDPGTRELLRRRVRVEPPTFFAYAGSGSRGSGRVGRRSGGMTASGSCRARVCCWSATTHQR